MSNQKFVWIVFCYCTCYFGAREIRGVFKAKHNAERFVANCRERDPDGTYEIDEFELDDYDKPTSSNVVNAAKA